MTEKIKTVVITGPTATGKTALAVELARRFDGRDRQHRLPAGLPRHGHRHRQRSRRIRRNPVPPGSTSPIPPPRSTTSPASAATPIRPFPASPRAGNCRSCAAAPPSIWRRCSTVTDCPAANCRTGTPGSPANVRFPAARTLSGLPSNLIRCCSASTIRAPKSTNGSKPASTAASPTG